jgi:hypothetical protein
MTIGLSRLGLVTQTSARVVRRQRIARTEVIANASLRPMSGFALRRRAQKSAGIGPVRRRPGDQLTIASSPSYQFTNSPILTA